MDLQPSTMHVVQPLAKLGRGRHGLAIYRAVISVNCARGRIARKYKEKPFAKES
jgi:hypothetical protein